MKKFWQRLQTTPFGELITGSAHIAHPGDITVPLGVRFAGQTILALHVALDKAATVRVAFDRAGKPRLSGIRNIRQRSSSEFGEVLRSEAAAARAHWVAVVLSTGWQAVLGQRAARPEAVERNATFARHRLLFESPESLVPRAQVDRVYTAIDHPVLDKSVVFSIRRKDVEDLIADVRRCGLSIASIRIGVAAQLELWLAQQGEAGLVRDLLVTDGLSALLLNVEQGDFVLPRSAGEAEQPRQSVQRPSAVEEDIARFVSANGSRSLAFVGPDELCVAMKKLADGAEIVRLPEHPAHDTQSVALSGAVQHELYFEAREVRPPLSRGWRKALIGYAALLAVLATLAVVNFTSAVRIGFVAYQQKIESDRRVSETEADTQAVVLMGREASHAAALQGWVGANYNARQLCYRLLRDVPASAVIDKLAIEKRDGQLTLSFVVLGDQDAQLHTHRIIERAASDLKYKIGAEEVPVVLTGATRAVHYRLHLIVPDAGEATS